jgi:hypothetical protein
MRNKTKQFTKKICPCGVEFLRYIPHYLLKKNRGRYCSKACANRYNPGVFRTGIDHPFWKLGITRTNNAIRRSSQYLKWTKQIYKRDDYTCQICGVKGKNIRANHIKKFADYPDLRFVVTNGIVICEKCDLKLVRYHEEEWEKYFYKNLERRGYLHAK